MGWIDAILQGVLLGGLYGLYAAGLSLVFGVMRLVNVAHGDFIILAAFLALVLQKAGIASPFLVLPLVMLLMFGFGYVLQRLLVNPALGGNLLRPVLVTFGLSVMLQNGLLEIFSADAQRLQAAGIEAASLALEGGLSLGVLPLLTFAACVAVIALLRWMLYATALGRALRATSDDAATAGLMGLDERHLYALATGLGCAVVSVAGVLGGLRTSFDPAAGAESLIFAFEAVIIGGLGSLWGTLAGGIALGVAQSLGARLAPDWQVLTGHLAFLLLLALRPSGLFPRRRD